MIRIVSSHSAFSFLHLCNNLYENVKVLIPFSLSHRCNTVLSQSSIRHHSNANLQSLVLGLIFSISSCPSISYCHSLHCQVIKSVNYKYGFIGDRLVTAYLTMGCVMDAKQLFDEMPNKDLVSWNSLISGLFRKGCVADCFDVFYRMKNEMGMQLNEVTFLPLISACTEMGAVDEGKYIHGCALKLGMLKEVKVVNSLINLYGKCGYIDASCQLLEEMPAPNLVSWNSIIAIHAQNGLSLEGMRMFKVLRMGQYRPDQASIISVYQACEDLGILKLAEAIHGLILSCGLFMNAVVATGLLNLYAKLGRLYASEKVFNEMSSPDKVAWTAMLGCYAVHGYGKEAIGLFELMVRESVAPDHVTFTHLLSACSHSGLVKEGKNYFKIMSEVYGVQPRLDHYSCMVDLLGRSGLLNDAYELMKGMPMEPNSGVWGALLGACRVYGNIKLGKEVAERLIALDPSDSRNYIMLSNMYSAAGRWRDASKVRASMKDRGLIRNSGCSFIEHGNKIHRFVVGDRSHPESEKIYAKLEELISKIRKVGVVPKTQYVLQDVDEEVKEDMINKHSEKLAIAFGLLVINANMPLIITKNLRICGDCHSTAKLVSLIENRTIIIRDTKRFHHFADGLCSCGDYW